MWKRMWPAVVYLFTGKIIMLPMDEIKHLVTTIGNAKSAAVTEKELGKIMFTYEADDNITGAYFKLAISLQQFGWLSGERIENQWLK